jgi:hypothetical protein
MEENDNKPTSGTTRKKERKNLWYMGADSEPQTNQMCLK